MIPADILQGRNNGLADYLNARIYVADEATPGEIAAAANIAARLAFEALSMDLPLGFRMSDYRASESTIAFIIGSAAKRFSNNTNDKIVVTTDGSRTIVAISDPDDAEEFARTPGASIEIEYAETPKTDPRRNKAFSLATLLTSSGLLGDQDNDRIPESVETTIVLDSGVRSIEVIDLAARIAHEAAGVRLPLVVANLKRPLPLNAIVIFRSNELPAGHGRIEITGNDAKIVITGGDAAGEAAAIQHGAQRLPYVWQHGKQHLHLLQVEKDLKQFFSRRSAAGQAAAALCAARRMAHEMKKTIAQDNLASATLEVHVEGDCRPCLDYISAQFPNLRVTTGNLNVQSGPLVFEDSHTLPWEVDDARRRIVGSVIPAIQHGSVVQIDLRVSESPEVRSALAREIETLILRSGADPGKSTVQVIAAHKQAYCWIDEFLKPRLKGASRIRIQYLEIAPGPASVVESPHRWLHELYPIDEVLARDLGIPLDSVSFHKSSSIQSETYTLTAEDELGQTILQETFEPRFAMRPMFDVFPDYATVRVSSGWLHAHVDGAVIADEKIETDYERFWKFYQSSTLPKIRAYLVQLYDGPPRPECAPHFATLEIDLWLSEPDYRIGIGEERISTLEALHEDIYFETLLFLELLGLKNSGRIIPRVHPARDGKDGFARVRFTGRAGPNPRVELTWKDSAGQVCRDTENLLPVQIAAPQIRALTVRAGHASVALEVAGVPLTKENIALFEAICEFHEHGIGLSWLSYENVDLLRLGSVEIPRTQACHRHPRLEPLTAGVPIVQLDTPIGPRECEEILRKLAALPEVNVFHAGVSYLGRDIWALEVVAPLKGKYISQAKASVTKPVLFITGRQHANEVASTSHILKLAELLATDSEIRKILDHVHFVLQPITNPDGAALVEELIADTPDFMLHAGYLGSLGTDVCEEQWSQNPLLPEALVRRELWEMWLPDIVLNPHGYPSHEWVQLFAGYTAWVKSRNLTARDWWIPRGWFIPRFVFMEQSREAAFHLRDYVTAAMHPMLGPWNRQMYRRYQKYTAADPSSVQMEFCNNLLVYSLPEALEPNRGFTFMQRYPEITFMETVTEVPDELAHGDWLKTLANAGLEFSLANARFLAENHGRLQRTFHHGKDGAKLRVFRRRP